MVVLIGPVTSVFNNVKLRIQNVKVNNVEVVFHKIEPIGVSGRIRHEGSRDARRWEMCDFKPLHESCISATPARGRDS